MNVLVACEESQRVTIEFRKLGHKAYSCDLLECSGNHPEWHIKKDVTLLLNGNCIFHTVDGVEHEISGKWDMIIAFPPCTYLTVTGNRWYNYEKYGYKAMATQWGSEESIQSEEKHYADYTSEETVKDVMEVKQDLNTRFGKKVQQYFDTDCLELNNTIIAKIENINHCPNQNTCCIVSPFVHCNYNYKSDSCIKVHKNFIHDCESVHKQMKAINNPNWHTVRLATVNSSDFFRLNEKLKLYISTYRELKQTLSYLRKCKSINTYDSCYVRYIKKQNDMWAKGKFTNAMLNYIRAKLSMQNVESGIWKSGCENATGYHDSRRYNKSRIDL